MVVEDQMVGKRGEMNEEGETTEVEETIEDREETTEVRGQTKENMTGGDPTLEVGVRLGDVSTAVESGIGNVIGIVIDRGGHYCRKSKVRKRSIN